ncbi:hypothetical protein K474DRAFT_1235642 [Panus rudis PR-1116 ss-1]|nr:hypothetical protein K474DRAFT_1235642 [Panus rudis PR-1116 ss-1]
MGTNIVVEFAKESRPRRHDNYDDRAPRARRPAGHRVIVSGLSRDTSWQDLKDFGREAGNVSFADIDRDVAGDGILEYAAREDAERAVKDLDGKDLRGQPVRVRLDEGVRCVTCSGIFHCVDLFFSDLVLITIVAMTVIVMIDVMIATAMIVTGMTVLLTGVVNALGPLLAVPTTTTVAPGLLRRGGITKILMIRGLRDMMIDGTMTDEEVIMMTGEALTLIMIAAGTMTDVVVTIAGVRRRTIGSKTDLQDTPPPTGTVVGLVKGDFCAFG